jgi:hypothetical protein
MSVAELLLAIDTVEAAPATPVNALAIMATFSSSETHADRSAPDAHVFIVIPFQRYSCAADDTMAVCARDLLIGSARWNLWAPRSPM